MEKKESGHDFDNALQLFLDSFLDAHPESTWPSWFRKCTTYGGHRATGHFSTFSFTAIPISALGPGELCEETEDGGYVLARTAMETRVKRYVISNAPSDVITIFEASIDVAMKRVFIVLDRKLSTIDGAGLLPLQR
ncbi:hypothetical protein [Pseudoduganella lutea]|uniref:Uncharacterized protein n=1 Tax=Pseudoduganella lutea TaxID=321985 RepID=A0A4P6L175_9BURK|nr:hypothetical protein [Pseudoduganella lutea]QBE65067.1 hypothetical protein EWM63_20440 [Pseudoduganella lutea]